MFETYQDQNIYRRHQMEQQKAKATEKRKNDM